MSASILSPRPDDRPPQREDWGTGVTISIIAHSLLIAALIWGVHWHSNTNESASAELWSAVPEAQAPPPMTAPPPPPEPAPTPAPQPAPPPPPAVAAPKPPDIAIEQEKERQKKLKEQQEQEQQQQQQQQAKLEQEKADKLKAEQQAKADAQKKAEAQKQLDAKQIAKMRAENLKRMMGELNAPTDATGTAAKSKGPSASYQGRIIARIRPNILLTDPIAGNPATVVEVRCAPDGTIIGRRITQSSGVKAWDDTVLRAIDKTQILPRDVDGTVPSPMLLTFRPQDVS